MKVEQADDPGQVVAAAPRRLRSRAWVVALVVIAIGTIIRIPQLGHGLNEMHAFRQTQTAYVALQYSRDGIDLAHTPLPVFGPSGDLPMEVPLVQAAASLLIDAGLDPATAVRTIGLLGFQAAAVLLTVLVLRWHGRRAAIVALVLFELSPFALGWGAASLIDFPAVALSLGMVVGLDAWFRWGSRMSLVAGALSAWLAFLVKATTPPAWCVLVLVSAITAYAVTRSWRRIALGVAIGPGIGVVLAGAWTVYADGVKEGNPLTRAMTSSADRAWNFGTLDQRLDPGTYAKIVERIGGEIAGPVGFGLLLAVVGIVLASRWEDRALRIGWLAVAAAAPLVFLNLYYVHNYYLIAVFPALAVSVALGIVAIAERVRFDTTAVAVAGTVIVLVGSAAIPVGWSEVQQWWTSPAARPASVGIAATTRPDDLLVLVGCDYDPSTLYFADRKGIEFTGDDSQGMWTREDIDRYGFLYTCDPTIDASAYLPDDRVLVPTDVADLYRIEPTG